MRKDSIVVFSPRHSEPKERNTLFKVTEDRGSDVLIEPVIWKYKIAPTEQVSKKAVIDITDKYYVMDSRGKLIYTDFQEGFDSWSDASDYILDNKLDTSFVIVTGKELGDSVVNGGYSLNTKRGPVKLESKSEAAYSNWAGDINFRDFEYPADDKDVWDVFNKYVKPHLEREFPWVNVLKGDKNYIYVNFKRDKYGKGEGYTPTISKHILFTMSPKIDGPKYAREIAADVNTVLSTLYPLENTMSDAEKMIDEALFTVEDLIEAVTKWDLYVIKKGVKSKVNKKPMSKKELEDMMDDYKKSGIVYDTLDTVIVKEGTNESFYGESSDNLLVVKDEDGYDLFVRKIDQSHVKVSADKKDAMSSTGGFNVYSILQLNDRPYYKEIVDWLARTESVVKGDYIEGMIDGLLSEASKNYKKGDLIFANDVGSNGLVGLVIDDMQNDYTEDPPYYPVYFRGLNGNIEQVYTDDKSELIDRNNIYMATENGDVRHYSAIAKKQRLPFNDDYLVWANESVEVGDADQMIEAKLKKGMVVTYKGKKVKVLELARGFVNKKEKGWWVKAVDPVDGYKKGDEFTVTTKKLNKELSKKG